MEKYNYWIAFRDSENYGGKVVTLPSALDTEEKIIALHKRLEREEGKKVVIINWKGIE